MIEAVRASNEDSGGRVLEIAGHEYVVRGRGFVTELDDLRKIVLRADDGAAVTVGDVGEVAFGPDMRRGIAELDGEGEVVGGIVVMRSGQNALAVIDAVKQRLEELKPGLPAGVEIVPTYDRSTLIRDATATLRRALLEELAIVSLVIFCSCCTRARR